MLKPIVIIAQMGLIVMGAPLIHCKIGEYILVSRFCNTLPFL